MHNASAPFAAAFCLGKAIQMLKKRLLAALTLLLALALVLSVSFTGLTKSSRVIAEEETTNTGDPKGEDDAGDGEILTTGTEDTDTTGEEEPEKTDEEKAAEKKEILKHSILLSLIGFAIAAVLVLVIVRFMFKKESGEIHRITTRQLTESALMVAIATVCSMVKIDLPFGGGVTIVSMLPIIMISHRYGWRWGITTAFVYSVIQLFLGLDNVGYATNTFMAFGVIFLDYIVAYTVIGLSGIFGRKRSSVAIGIIVTFALRFACHYVTGVWIWKEWMPETYMGLAMKSPWIYSALYNGWYMLAELAATLLVAMLIYEPLKQFFTAPDNENTKLVSRKNAQ